MFGYVVVNQDELKIREYKIYRSYYCGLCNTLKERHGITGQMTLNFDMVFLGMLLTGLYEPENVTLCKRCPVHPLEKHQIQKNSMMDYVADMTILLAYHKLEDDWDDEHNLLKKTAAGVLHRQYKKVAKMYPVQLQAVVQYMNDLKQCQEQNTDNIDEVAGLTGHMMSTLFCYKKDEWEQNLSKIGFYLGKFIYLLDAYDDLESDIKKKQYNVWIHYMSETDFEKRVEKILEMMMSECSREFEKLPILQDVNILRNILYAGVFTKYNQRKKLRNDQERGEK